MATEVGSIYYSLGLDKEEFDKSISKVTQDLGKFQENLTDIGNKMSDVGKEMTAKLTAPILGVGVAALKMGGDFEQGMNRVQALTQSTAEEFQMLEDQARELGSSTKFSASEASDAMGFLAMAGFTANEIYGAMPGTLQLAASAQMDLASTADVVSNILTGYGLQTEDLTWVNDQLVKSMISANVDLRMLGESFKYAGPFANSAGLSFEETAAAIALMGNAGIQGTMAGTSLRGAMSRILDPTDKTIAIMEKLDISLVDSQGELLSLVEVLQILEDSGASTGDMMAMFGQRAGPALMTLVEQGSGELQSFVEMLEGSGGTAEQVANVQMQGFNGAMVAMRSAIEAVAISLTKSGFMDSLTQIIKDFTAMLQNLSRVNPEMLNMAVVVLGVAAAIGPLLIVLGTMISSLGSIIGGVSAMSGVVMALSSTVLIPLLLLIGAIAGAFLLFKSGALDPFINTIVNFLKPSIDAIIIILKDGLLKELQRTWDIISPMLIPLLKLLALVLGSIVVGAIVTVVGILAGLGVAITGLAKVFNAFIGKIGDDIRTVVDFFKWLYNVLVGNSIIPDLINEIAKWFAKLPGMILDGLKGLKDAISKPFSDALGGVKDMASKTADNIRSNLSNAFNINKRNSPSIADRLRELSGAVNDTLTGIEVPMYRQTISQELGDMTTGSITPIINIGSINERSDVDMINRELSFRNSIQ